MTGQAAAAPVIALLTEFLSPALGWLGKYLLIFLQHVNKKKNPV